MPAINFPSPANTNDTYTLGTKTWKFNGSAWELVPLTAGYTGSLGYTGSKGDIGYTGSLGYTGSKGTLQFTQSTSAPVSPNVGDIWVDSYTGKQYSYYNDGDSSQWVELGNAGTTGFTGSKGDIGYSGSLGYTGSKGDIGYSGSLGYTGSKGDLGYSGSLGYTGSIGYTGSQGYTGSIGYTGSQGYTGSKGDIGFTGSQGNTGLGFNIAKTYSTVAALLADTSPSGIVAGEFALITTVDPNDVDNSKLYVWNGSAYSFVSDLSGSTGFTGSKGDIGFTGSKGDTGFVGSKGDTGFTGSQGNIGYTGSQGDLGYTGSIGYTGSKGTLQFTQSTSAPGSANVGDIWVDSYTGKQYSYYNDGDSSQWVELGSVGAVGFTGSAGPTAGSANQVIYKNGSNEPTGNSNLTFDGSILSANKLSITASSGDEGGEMLLTKPATNSTIAGTGVTIDIYQNRLRFFEQGGSARGAFIDITAMAASASTPLGTVGEATTSTAASGPGYMGLPQNSQSSAYTLVIGDAGKHIYVTTTATITIPANGSVAYPIGTVINLIAGSGVTITVAITTDTLYLGGTGTTGSRTIAAFGMATLVKLTSTTWIIGGTGVS